MKFNLLSLNVRGLRDKNKRKTLFYYLRQKKFDIIYLQETHCSNDNDVLSWSKEWNGPAFWSTGSNNSKGVGILFNSKHNFDVRFKEIDDSGRLIELHVVDDDGDEWTLINVYAPTKGTERKVFFEGFRNKLRKNVQATNNLLLAGDWNCTLNSDIDRQNNNTVDRGAKELKEIITAYDLEDIWRRRNPSKKAFSYLGLGKSRIDYWLTSKSLSSHITKCEIIENPLTAKDHRGVFIGVNNEETKRGPGVWKMNRSVIESDLFKNTFAHFWQSWVHKSADYEDIKSWWDIGKQKIKELTIWVATQTNQSKKHIEHLEKRLNSKSENENSNEEQTKWRQEIQNYYKSKSEAARIRSKQKWYESGEKSTAYFFALEKKRQTSKSWKKIKISENHYETKIDKILAKQVDFYKELYTSQGIDVKAADELLKSVDKKLTAIQCEDLEKEITKIELKKALDKMADDKSPGDDGILTIFYKLYWDTIGDDFTKLVKHIHSINSMCKSQNRGLITLLYKQGEREDIANWRPITLLNNDYKIIAKTIAERLKSVLPDIIHEDQKGFVKGRRIEHGVRLIQDVIEYSEMNKKGGAIIFLDQRKAFDRVEHEWLTKVLETFRFGHNFRTWIQLLYNNAESSILTNGFISKSFKLTRSVRQGCPIAPYLYVLQAEPFAESIRKNEKIEGIMLPNAREAKIGMFADDNQTFISSTPSFVELSSVLKLYEKASGALVNYQKTKGLLLGTWRTKPPPWPDITWEENVKALGIIHGFNIDEQSIWNKKIERIKSTLLSWKKRDLTYQGKVLIIKALGMSVVGYEIRMKGINDHYIKALKEIFYDFLWNSKRSLVNRASVSLPKEEGGLQMLDIEGFIKTIHIRWIEEIINSEDETWNTLPKLWLKQAYPLKGNDIFLLKCSSLDNLGTEVIPKFYMEALKSWIELKQQRTIVNKSDILNECLFLNNFVTHKRKSLLYKTWINSDLIKIKDIWDNENNDFIDERSLLEKLVVKRNWMTEYLNIKSSIPKQWKDILKVNTMSEPPPVTKLGLSGENQLIINNKSIIKSSNKAILRILQRNYQKPKCMIYWNRTLGKDLNWGKIWKNLKLNKCENKIKDFQWKCIHNVINTNVRLRLMRKGNGVCKMCNEEEETQFHLFWECKNLDQLKELILNYTEQNDIAFVPTKENIIFGWDENNTCKENSRMATLILFMKWEIWKNRNNKIFNNREDKAETIFYKIKHQAVPFV